MATEDFCLSLSPLLSPRWSPPRPFLPSSNSNYSMVMLYQGSNHSMDDLPENQEHDNIVDPAPYLARDSASDWRPRGGGIMTMNNQGFEESNMGFEESMEMTTCFYFPPSPTNFPLYRPMPNVFFVSGEQENISLALSCQHILEDKSGALHVINWEESPNIFKLLFDDFKSYADNNFGDFYEMEGVVPKLDANYDERKVTLRRINWFEQDDVDIVDQPVYEQVVVVQQLIQNMGGELDVILGGGVVTVNRLERRHGQGSPTTPEPLLILQAKASYRVWLAHDGQWAAEFRCRCSRLNNGRFTTVEDAISAYELVARLSAWKDLTSFAGLFEKENRSNLPLQLPLTAQKLNPIEDFGLACCNGTRNDEIESIGTGSEETEDCIMADKALLNSRCLGKRKTKEKNPGGERRSKKTNGVRIAIPLEDILQIKGMSLKDAANHLGVGQSSLKYACREYGNPRWPPRKLITQSHPTETPALVDQEGIPQSNSDTLPSDQALAATVEKITSVIVKENLPPPFSPTARPESLDEDFGNVEAEAVFSQIPGIELTPRGERRTGGVRIAISLEEILQTKKMLLKDAAKHLNVSKSTLKRVCRGYDIPRWPPRGEHKLISQSCPIESPAVVDKEPIPQLNSDTLLPSNQVSTAIGTKSVIVKARFDSGTLKFQLSWPWRMEELEEQVKKRLRLKAENYYINYKDEDNEYILIGCDEDLQDHISSSILLGTNSIELELEESEALVQQSCGSLQAGEYVLCAATIHSTLERAFQRNSSQSAKPHIHCALTYLTPRSNKPEASEHKNRRGRGPSAVSHHLGP